ncbi:MAG: DsrE family protein [Alphaproteobacteria bacterium]|nr:DsrE family protein [Alphaproteobacteria bacterium]
MAQEKTLVFALMDAPYESANTATALRLIDIAVRRGYAVKVFAYEGAVLLPFSRQQRHPNAIHGRSVEEENHLLTREVIAFLIAAAKQNGGTLDWVNCGLCVDERGAGEAIEGVRRGSPADFWQMAQAADNTLVIGTR